jgi:hypothetical protein
MYCRNCGAQNEDGRQSCVSCGAALEPVVASGVPAVIPNYLVQSILVTVLCCVPFGIPAIVYASQVNSKIQSGDLEGARQSSEKAKMWAWISFGLGLGVGIISAIVQIVALSASGNF